MGFVTLRGNLPVLFLLFFGAATLLLGAAYQAYQFFAGTGEYTYLLLTGTAAVGFLFSFLVVIRILVKAT
jgi:hypothetical protein